MRAGTAPCARRCRHHARQRRRARRPCPLGRDPAQPLAHDPSSSLDRPLMPRRGASKDNTGRLAAVTLDEASLGRSNDDVEHERRVAIYDLLENNTFRPVGHRGGPYALQLGISGSRLVFDIRLTDSTPVIAHMLSLAPFRRVVKDYFVV